MVWVLGLELQVLQVLRVDMEFVAKTLDEKDRVREEAIRLSREIVRRAGDLISMVHNRRFNEADETLQVLNLRKEELMRLLLNHTDLLYSGLAYNAFSEYAEALVVYSLILKKKMPSITEIGVPVPAYLQGLGDVVGELRRHVVDLLDEAKVEEASNFLKVMELIYENLKRLDYPDAITPGLRHKVDVAARLIEDTRVLILSTKNSLRCQKD
ncbi:MAG: haloacid dehalogenase [Thermosphaera sp.]